MRLETGLKLELFATRVAHELRAAIFVSEIKHGNLGNFKLHFSLFFIVPRLID